MTTSTKSTDKKLVSKKNTTKVVKKTVAPKKKLVKKVEEPLAVEETPVVEETPAVEESPVVEDTSVLEESPVVEEETFLSNDVNVQQKKSSKKPTKEDVHKQFEDLFKIYEDELKTRKQPKQDVSLVNYLGKLKTNVYKLLKIKTRNVDASKSNTSGFMKPVNVSDELRNFIKLESNEPITRVLITKKLCQYIKENNLQKEEDRREILPDGPLTKLFGIQPNETEKLTYYSMQKRVQSHIFKV